MYRPLLVTQQVNSYTAKIGFYSYIESLKAIYTHGCGADGREIKASEQSASLCLISFGEESGNKVDLCSLVALCASKIILYSKATRVCVSERRPPCPQRLCVCVCKREREREPALEHHWTYNINNIETDSKLRPLVFGRSYTFTYGFIFLRTLSLFGQNQTHTTQRFRRVIAFVSVRLYNQLLVCRRYGDA